MWLASVSNRLQQRELLKPALNTAMELAQYYSPLLSTAIYCYTAEVIHNK